MIAVLAFFGYTSQYMQRINISVAMVCMVNNTALTGVRVSNDTLVSHTRSIILLNGVIHSINLYFCCCYCLEKEGEYVWSKPIQNQIFSSYFYGYCSTQV